LHVLYSFRRCPYAIRARLALAYSQIGYELREVVLKNKPQAMLQISAKGTVPVLIQDNGKVLDESLDIMRWALNQYDPNHWLGVPDDALALIKRNDDYFKHYLDRYKYFDRYPEQHQADYFDAAMVFINELEIYLQHNAYLCAEHITLADAAVFPFVRQFAFVDKAQFDQLAIPKVQVWLETWLDSGLFNSVMSKYPPWEEGNTPLLLP